MLGFAVFSNLTINKSGSYVLTASATGLPKAASGTFTIRPATGHLSISTQPIGTSAGSIMSHVIAKIVDIYGNPIVNAYVIASLSSGTMTGTTYVATNASGLVTFSNLAVAAPGTYTMMLSSSGVASVSTTSFGITPAVHIASRLAYSTPPVSTTASTVMKPVVVQLYDATGDAILQAGVMVTIKISSGTLSGTVVVATNTSGQAIFSTLEILTKGTFTLTASATLNGMSASIMSGAFVIS